MPTFDIYKIVTDRFIDALNQGIIPWQKPWNAGDVMPTSRTSGKPYRGINIMLLGIALAINNFASTEWVTYKQAEALGGKVRKGEKSTMITFWKRNEYTKANAQGEDELRKGLLLRYYNVFNLDQCDGIEPRRPRETGPVRVVPANEAATALLAAWNGRPVIKHGAALAAYSPKHDEILMPNIETFVGVEEYHHTLHHEMIHSTGHKSRLDREGSTNSRTNAYAFEELIAEIGASYLSTSCGIYVPSVTKNSIAYVQDWVKRFKEDSKMIMQASSAAQKAVDMITNVKFEVELAEAA